MFNEHNVYISVCMANEKIYTTVQHITLRGTVMLRTVWSLIALAHSEDTAIQLYLPIGNTSSNGDWNVTNNDKQNPSLVATGRPQCSMLNTPWGLWGATSAPKIS